MDKKWEFSSKMENFSSPPKFFFNINFWKNFCSLSNICYEVSFGIAVRQFEIFSKSSCGHSEQKCQIWFGNCSWGYSAWIQHFCTPLAFLGIKDFRKIIKGQRRSWRPNHRPESQQNQNFLIFSCWWLHLEYLIYRFHYFWVSKSLRPKRPP